MTGDQADLDWLAGYRERAQGKPRPEIPTEKAEGWDDLDALMQLIKRALADESLTIIDDKGRTVRTVRTISAD